jgi:hypothetical protein
MLSVTYETYNFLPENVFGLIYISYDFYEANCFLYIFRVEVDCQQIFLPGQLGVAIGRITFKQYSITLP